MQVNKLIESTKRKQFPHLHAPRTLDLKGSAWRISAHFCTACVRSISAKVDQRGSENAPWNRQGVLRNHIRVVRLHSQPQRGLTSILLNKAFSLGGRVVGMLVNYSRTGLYHRKVRLARRPRGTNENGDCICDCWSLPTVLWDTGELIDWATKPWNLF